MKSDAPKPELDPQAQPNASESARLPYTKPALRRLGSVRQLTLGSTGNTGDVGSPRKMP